MYLYGSIEQVGTGTEMIIRQCLDFGLKTPEFQQDIDFITTIWRKEGIDDDIVKKQTVDIDSPHVTPHVTPHVEELIKILNEEMSRLEIQAVLKLSDRENFRLNYLQPALKHGFIEMIMPVKPKSVLEKYCLTAKGRKLK
jgi:ATP-dependent DNA helicase RecG